MRIVVRESLGLAADQEARLQAVDALEYAYDEKVLVYIYAEREYEEYLPKHFVVAVEDGEKPSQRQFDSLAAAVSAFQALVGKYGLTRIL